MMQSGYTVKRYNEVPKMIILTRDRIFQLRFCRSLIYGLYFIFFKKIILYFVESGAIIPE